MNIEDLKKIPNSDWINVKAEIVKAYLSNKDHINICSSWMNNNYTDKLRLEGFTVSYDQYKSRYEISGWNTEMWSDNHE